ncbi:MmcB family DNA repair protein [Sphingomonas sp. RS2018]
MVSVAPLCMSAAEDSLPERLIAADVVRGVTRMFLAHDIVMIAEVPLDGGRRADLMGVGPKGELVIVEVKVARADLLGDAKWTDYLAHCDRFFWGVPAGFDASPLEGEAFLPERAGVIVADRYDAVVVREAAVVAMPAPARRKCTIGLARRAARRVIGLVDPDAFAGQWRGG